MKRIRKIETSIGLTGNVVNNESTSTANAYSCNYINNDLKALILDMAHPIGSYYWSSDSTNPHDLFGGTWVQIKDKFIIAVGDNHTVGTSYGSNTKDISHTHGIGHTHGVPGVKHTHSIGHTHGVPGVAHTHSTGNHTLTVSEMPSHTHNQNQWIFNGASASGTHYGYGWEAGTGTMYNGMPSDWSSNGYSGGGGAHNHGNTGSTTPNAATTNSQSTSTSGETTPSAATTNSQSTSTSGSGGSTTLDITPACEAAYCWKRTA